METEQKRGESWQRDWRGPTERTGGSQERCSLQGPREDSVPRRRDRPGESRTGAEAWLPDLDAEGHLEEGSLRTAAGRAHPRDFRESL